MEVHELTKAKNRGKDGSVRRVEVRWIMVAPAFVLAVLAREIEARKGEM